jgi:parallel beta-helix repeat protein
MYITANNITLDCQDHKLNGTYYGTYGIYLGGVSGNTIKNCIIINFIIGIELSSSSNSILTNNRANSNDYGIRVDFSSNNILTNNTANASILYGIILYSSSNNNIYNNTANSNPFGIELYNSSNNILTNNTANSNNIGIRVEYSSNNNLIYSNTANSNHYGIELRFSSNNNILTNNTANSNSWDGIYLSSSSNNNNIIGNTVNSNVNIGFGLSSSSNNSIYNNYFNNSVNAYDDGNNFWNTTKTLGTNIIGGPYIGGNFWSDYNGVDTSNPPDGIGDTLVPYNSNGNITNGGDYLPLTTNKLNFTITSCPSTINNPGIYALNQSLSSNGTCITINSTNVTLDCKGYTIMGNSTGYGISNIGFKNVTVKNCVIKNFTTGIYLYSSSNNLLTNNTANLLGTKLRLW